MDVVLHLGAHRTGSTSFQDYMARAQSEELAFWGPKVTRGGVFDGIQGSPLGMRPGMRAKGRITVQIARLQATGARALVISDENTLGSLRSNLRCASLYPEVGLRMARFHAAFAGRISRVVLQIRALDNYWASVLAFGVMRGIAEPEVQLRERLARGARSWRDVITDLSCALPGVPILVTSFEQFAQRPNVVAERVTGLDLRPPPPGGIWANRQVSPHRLRRCIDAYCETRPDTLFDPNGLWQPFNTDQRYAMRAQTARDLEWLRAGADGLAIFQDNLMSEPAIRAGPAYTTIRGSEDNDCQERHLARPG